MTINTTREVLVEAFLRGRAWDPNFPNLANLDLSRVKKMTGNEEDALQLVESYQRSTTRYNLLVEAFHQRFEPDYDGRVGHATLALANTPRCPLPDFAPPPGASFDYGDPDLNSVVERMQQAAQRATGSGSWKPGCYDTPNVHEIKVSYDTAKLSSKQKEWLPAVKAHNATAVAAMGLRVVEVPVGQFANVKFYGRNFGGSTIGMAQFNNSSCGDSVFCTVSPNYAPNLRMFLILVMHEFGHTMNFEHSNKFIMNPFIMDVPEYWIRRESGTVTYTDVRYAKGKQFFGGDPTEGPVPVPVTSPEFIGEIFAETNLSGGISLRGTINVEVQPNQAPGSFPQILVPSNTPGRYKFARKATL